jgi:dolichol-phosphate mannosyltransferase
MTAPERERALVVVPTYNEADNVEKLCRALIEANLPIDILFIDDNSPDNTGRIIDRLCAQFSNVRVLHRPGKAGVGAAHHAGIGWAYEQGYRILVTMDCDFTHTPDQVASLLHFDPAVEVVVGSRFLRASSLTGWAWRRKFFTHLAHWMTATFLLLPFDASGALRRYRLDRIRREAFDLVENQGYSFFWESLFILWVNGYSIAEIPIDLPPRTYGTSKMRVSDIVDGAVHLVSVWRRKYFDRTSVLLQPTAAPAARANSPDEWDVYWADQNLSGRSSLQRIYDAIARFYRGHIIRANFVRAMERHFAKSAQLLHAGCGGGELDAAILDRFEVTAVDFSPRSLERYGAINGHRTRCVLADIADLPQGEESFDGVYNLGVMEHFPEAEAQAVLAEFYRVLRPGGKLVLFWPPNHGLSVFALRVVHRVLKLVGKDVRLHPDEPNLLRGKRQAQELLAASGFALSEYSFGPHDLFTYALVVGERLPARVGNVVIAESAGE